MKFKKRASGFYYDVFDASEKLGTIHRTRVRVGQSTHYEWQAWNNAGVVVSMPYRTRREAAQHLIPKVCPG